MTISKQHVNNQIITNYKHYINNYYCQLFNGCTRYICCIFNSHNLISLSFMSIHKYTMDVIIPIDMLLKALLPVSFNVLDEIEMLSLAF